MHAAHFGESMQAIDLLLRVTVAPQADRAWDLPAREFVQPFAGLAESLRRQQAAFGIGFARMPIVGILRHPLYGRSRRVEASNPQGHPTTLLHGRCVEDDRRYVEPPALELDRAALPAGQDDVEDLIRVGPSFIEDVTDAKRLVLPTEPADADAEIDPAGRELVQAGNHPGGEHRVPIRQNQNARADANATGLGGEVRHGDHDVEPLLLVEMVFGNAKEMVREPQTPPSPSPRNGDPSSSPPPCSRPRWAGRDQVASLALLSGRPAMQMYRFRPDLIEGC